MELHLQILRIMKERGATEKETLSMASIIKDHIVQTMLMNYLESEPNATPCQIVDKAAKIHRMEKFKYSMELYPPDEAAARRYLAQGVDINAKDDDGTILSGIILGYPNLKAMDPCSRCMMGTDCKNCKKERGNFDSRYLPDVVRFFLENGYDVHKDNGRWGAKALDALCWSSYDKYIVEAAKLLLDAGADPRCPVEDGQDVFASVDWKLTGCVAGSEDLELECLFTVLYDVLEAKTMGLPYGDIQWYDTVIGKRIDRFYSCTPSMDEATIALGEDNCFKDDIVLECEGLALVVTHHCHAYVNPNKKTGKLENRTEYWDALVGKRIENIQFMVNTSQKDQIIAHGSMLQILLDDGGKLVVRNNGDRFNEEFGVEVFIEKQ